MCVSVPEGVLVPVVIIINDTAVRVSWQPPLKPNGPIIGYLLYVNDDIIDPQTAWPTSYVMAGLQPYTVYHIQVGSENCCVKLRPKAMGLQRV